MYERLRMYGEMAWFWLNIVLIVDLVVSSLGESSTRSRWIFMVALGEKDSLGSRGIDAEQTKRLAANTGLPPDLRAQSM